MPLEPTDPKTSFLYWTEEYEATKGKLKDIQGKLESLMYTLGVDSYHQNPLTGVVYKVYVPEGTFISFKKIDYKRTSLPGEKGGTVLSKSEAESAGFTLSK
jgi:hypothetical protein